MHCGQRQGVKKKWYAAMFSLRATCVIMEWCQTPRWIAGGGEASLFQHLVCACVQFN